MEVEQRHAAGQQWDWPLQHNDGVVELHNDKRKFEVALDAQYFTTKEIQVKVIGNILDIHFEHNPKTASLGDTSRTVVRSYTLPDDVDASTIKWTLTAMGTLLITANKKA